jgi:GTP cyclohydrolase I
MLADIQQSDSEFKFPIERVGITDFKLPIYIDKKEGGVQHTVANIDVFVDLKKENKGINMSRLPIGLQKFTDQKLNATVIDDIAEYVKNKSEAEQCQLIYKFPFFIKKIAPVSKEPGFVYNNIIFDGTKGNDGFDFWLTVKTNITSLCPCSKEISINSAHNQRSLISISINPKINKFIWIEDLIKIAENNSSCNIYSILKRTDEKHVTEKAYDNPKFVEDIVRGCYSELIKNKMINHFRIEVHNYESIHQHNATAIMDSRFKRDFE